jgi:hypothetical protein
MAKAFDKVPTWLMITVFLLIVTILGLFTDLFTTIVGTLVMIIIFAGGYDNEHLEEH